ncbi:MAG TPA: isoaspartyl peptidase/L-asparaginase, partial [Tepidisphaeraceae bacterium]
MPDPILVSTWKFGLPANNAGWPHLVKSGLLDGLEQTCVACELDPNVDSVGVGGVPDASGEVSLDGAIMLSPAQSAGVAYVRNYAHPVTVARRVMEKTPHKLLVGEGAERFAEEQGFATAQLLTPRARQKWEAWRATGQFKDFHIGEKSHDTIGVLAMDAAGNIGAACSTSGRAFKLPGRVGDSP